MTGDELYAARAQLGEMWGRDKPVSAAEMGRLLRLGGRDVGLTIREYERCKRPVSGPIAVAVEMMLAGAKPPDI